MLWKKRVAEEELSAFDGCSNIDVLSSHLTLYFLNLQQHVVRTHGENVGLEFEEAVQHYIRHLADLNQRYPWTSVLMYHVEFHRDRCQEMTRGQFGGWSTADSDLMKSLYDSYEKGLLLRRLERATG